MRKTVKRLDRISDVLCSVLDMTELIRNVHPDKQFRRAADEAFAKLSTFLNQLNTHQGLYQALKRVLDHPSIPLKFSHEERQTATLLLKDFEKSGIHMPSAIRSRFVELNDRILGLGQNFIERGGPFIRSVEIADPYAKLEGVPKKLIDALVGISKKRGNKGGPPVATVDIGSIASGLVLRLARNENVRKEVFVAMNSGHKLQIALLEAMLRTRGELANLLGHASFAEMALQDKMARTPANVMSFLESVAAAHKPKAQADVSRLQNVKRAHATTAERTPTINSWDRSYYAQFISPSSALADTQSSSDPFHPSPTTEHAPVSPYFSVGTTFEGLSSLFTTLYGISLQPAPVRIGETWHPDVRKLDVVHETDGKIGIIYCDLYQRDGPGRKYDTAAHFTIRCSRKVDEEEEGWGSENAALVRNRDAEKDQKDGKYQLPIVVLVTDFRRPSAEMPSLLSITEVGTLFHEMGHAMHSMLARTQYQHIAGTRVKMDFVEVPSILTEHFAHSPRFLTTFARHYKTGEVPTPAFLRSHHAASSSFEALETHNQINMALVDQMYHSPLACQNDFDTTRILAETQNRVGVIPYVEGTAFQVQFLHLFNYGASYYTYLWSRRWARRVWGKFFGEKDMREWREGGEILNQELFKWGGGIDPWDGLEKVGVVKDGEREGKWCISSDDVSGWDEP
ncbi:Mitochondrial intermediate peptidase [Borealophlyctis nickersoniae]|nr:Mitochondrial intermediate peptidase [Borealophlyctis nickersoniae]